MNTLAIVGFTFGFIAFQMMAYAEPNEAPENIAQKCALRTGVKPTEVAALKAGDFSKPNESLRCYAKCILDHSELLEEGMIRENLLVEKLSGKISKDQINKAIAKCKGVTGQDHCQVAYNLAKCFSDNKVKLI